MDSIEHMTPQGAKEAFFPRTLGQAAELTAGSLETAVRMVESHYGEGAAEKYPELVGACLQSMATHFHALLTDNGLRDTTEAIHSLDS